MKIFKEHLNSNLFFLLTVLFAACGGNEKKVTDDKIVARIGSETLNENVLDSLMNNGNFRYKTSYEVVKNWIDSRVLYKAAVEDSLIYSDEYQELLKISSIELANAMYLKKELENFEADISYSDIIDFYENNSDEFRLLYKSFYLRRADFNSYDSALQFRKEVFSSGWINSYNKFKNENNISFSEALYENHNIRPVKLQRLVNNLMEDEVSIVLKTELNQYSVVQLIRKLKKNDTPELKYISDEVKNRLQMIRKKQFVNDLINDLYIKYQVETFKDSL